MMFSFRGLMRNFIYGNGRDHRSKQISSAMEQALAMLDFVKYISPAFTCAEFSHSVSELFPLVSALALFDPKFYEVALSMTVMKIGFYNHNQLISTYSFLSLRVRR